MKEDPYEDFGDFEFELIDIKDKVRKQGVAVGG